MDLAYRKEQRKALVTSSKIIDELSRIISPIRLFVLEGIHDHKIVETFFLFLLWYLYIQKS